MESVRVKICGITSLEDAKQAVAVGADAIGLVFYPKSPRYVSIEQARLISLAVGPFVTVVGLFVNAEPQDVQRVLEQVPLQLLQFHGDESLEECEQYQRPYMKALRMSDDLQVEQAIAAYPSASGILLDAYKKGVPGGTGECFDWARVPQHSQQNIVVAGGLNASNVAQAITATLPYGVDVSGGVESAPGEKSHLQMQEFMTASKA